MTYIPLKDALVKILQDSNEVASKLTGADGRATFILPKGTYTLNVEKEGYQPYSEVITLDRDLTKEVYLSKLPSNPSGFDPNDSRWTPEGGWDELYDFLSDNELNNMCNNTCEYVYTENSLLEFNPPDKYIGRCSKIVDDKIFARVAMTLKVTDIMRDNVVASVIAEGVSDVSYNMGIVIGVTEDNRLLVLDYHDNSVLHDIPYNGEWIVIMVDFVQCNVCYLLSGSSEMTCTELSYCELGGQQVFLIGIAEINCPNECVEHYTGKNNVEVDWVGIKYLQIGG